MAGQEPLIEAVVFDVGETLVDETRAWTGWAHSLGVTPLTFMGVLGAAIERGEDHRAPFRTFAPDLDLRAAAATRAAAGEVVDFDQSDLYPDALPCLRRLRAAGYRLAVAGNQPARTEAVLRELDVEVELVASSASLGVQKPDPAFFTVIAERLGLPPAAIAAVGDRVDNDVRPAAAAGLHPVFLRRGPWAWIQAGRSDPPEAAATIDSLAELPEVLARLG
jgi:HAD superfamily hydrolase (TIGR01549 family)